MVYSYAMKAFTALLSLLFLGQICPAEDATPPAAVNLPLSDNQELYAAFEAHARYIYNRLPAMDRLYVHEGPGFTRETAWVVEGAELSQAPAAVVRLMYFIYEDEDRFPVLEFNQDRVEIDGKIYLYTGNVVLYQGKRYLVEQWVDISAYWRK